MAILFMTKAMERRFAISPINVVIVILLLLLLKITISGHHSKFCDWLHICICSGSYSVTIVASFLAGELTWYYSWRVGHRRIHRWVGNMSPYWDHEDDGNTLILTGESMNDFCSRISASKLDSWGKLQLGSDGQPLSYWFSVVDGLLNRGVCAQCRDWQKMVSRSTSD